MRFTQMFLKTYRDAPADAEIKSHKLLVRAGYMKKQSAGTYIYMPLAIKVINKIEKVIREELDKVGCVELQMPMLLTQDVYAGRIDKFGNEIMKCKYEDISYMNIESEELFLIRKNGNCGVADMNGNELINFITKPFGFILRGIDCKFLLFSSLSTASLSCIRKNSSKTKENRALSSISLSSGKWICFKASFFSIKLYFFRR